MKKIISILLVVLMVGVIFASCNDTDTDTSSLDTTVSGTTSIAGGVINPPFEKKDWGDVVLEMIAAGTDFYSKYEFWYDQEYEGDNDVIKKFIERSRYIKENYGIEINITKPEDGDVQNAVDLAFAGDMQVDLVADAAYNLLPKTINGWYYDIKAINAEFNNGEGWLDLDADYWDQNIQSDLSFGDKVFFLTGDICVSEDEMTWVMFFNQDLIEQHGLENPYALVDNNEWTLDKLIQMAKTVELKHGDDWSYNPEDNDVYGLVFQNYDLEMFMLGFEQRLVQKDQNDYPELRGTAQAHVDAYSKLFQIVSELGHGRADKHGLWNSGVYGQEVQIFANGNALFMPNQLSRISTEQFATSDVNFGILPMPKVSTEQDEYSSTVNVYGLKGVAIPILNEENLEATLYALEALAYLGKEMVTPAHYEKTLKLQSVKDEESEKMLDLIFDNRSYNLGSAYDLGGMINFYGYVISRGSGSELISSWDERDGVYQDAIDNFIETFEALYDN